MENLLVKNEIIQHNEIEKRLKKIANYKGKSSWMHFNKFIKELASQLPKEILFREIESSIKRMYECFKKAATN